MNASRVLIFSILGLSALVLGILGSHQLTGTAQHKGTSVVRVSDGRIGPNLVTSTSGR